MAFALGAAVRFGISTPFAKLLLGGLPPVLLMVGLRTTPASATAPLLNLEGVFTALLVWVVFRENVDRWIAIGMAFIVAGGVVLSWQPSEGFRLPIGGLAVTVACKICGHARRA